MLRLALCLITIWAAPALADVTTVRLTIGSMSRTYQVHVPDTVYDAPSLVLVLHGGGGSGSQIIRQTAGRFNALAERDGNVVIYPDAIDGIWDLGEGTVSEALTARRDDIAFLNAVISRAIAEHGVDPHRVFATGMSRGGQAAFALACKRPGLIRAIAPVAMTLPDFLKDDCEGTAPLPMLLIHGTADPIVPYDGGPITIGRKDRGRVLSARDTLDLFAERNRCGEVRRTKVAPSVQSLAPAECAAPVVLLRVEGGGHTWPGPRIGRPKWIVGPTNTDLPGADIIWTFFDQFK